MWGNATSRCRLAGVNFRGLGVDSKKIRGAGGDGQSLNVGHAVTMPREEEPMLGGLRVSSALGRLALEGSKRGACNGEPLREAISTMVASRGLKPMKHQACTQHGYYPL